MYRRRNYSRNDVRPGLALFVDPTALNGGMPGADGGPTHVRLPVTDPHYVLVVSVEGELAAITILSSLPRDTGWVPVLGKKGNGSWIANLTYFHPGQVWTVAIEALLAAARTRDVSPASDPNKVTQLGLDDVLDKITAWHGRHWRVPGLLSAETFWRLYWTRYRPGEIWNELRMSSVVFASRRVRFETGRS